MRKRWDGYVNSEPMGMVVKGRMDGVRNQQGLAGWVKGGEQLGSAAGVGSMGGLLLPSTRNWTFDDCVNSRGWPGAIDEFLPGWGVPACGLQGVCCFKGCLD